jgi:hypothetical protein
VKKGLAKKMTSEGYLSFIETSAGLGRLVISERYRNHPLLHGGPYFTLPTELLGLVVNAVGEERFDTELLEMEYALSQMCDDHSRLIGFWGGQPINYPLLKSSAGVQCDFLIEELVNRYGKTAHEARAILALADNRLEWINCSRRGYCGWLLTHPVFREEQLQIFRRWAGLVARWGIPHMGPVVRHAKAVHAAKRAKAEHQQFIREFEQFFIRWRLDDIPAPSAPLPLAPHLPVNAPRPLLGHMHFCGTTFYFPDILPLPKLDMIRELLEEALRDTNVPDHLAEWFEIVHSDNVAKNAIGHYARVFELQHFVRALYARHATALRQKKTVLMVALGEYLGVSGDSVERDLSFIADRLGRDWYLPGG